MKDLIFPVLDVRIKGIFNPKNGKCTWAYRVYRGRVTIHEQIGQVKGPLKQLKNVGAYMTAVFEAVNYIKSIGATCRIHYKLNNLYFWVGDLWNDKRWACNSRPAKEYRIFIKSNILYIAGFKHDSGGFYPDK